tara:strand:- start:135 stop:362 length:228 start_codon:yes stop_codon:yes gene_type:complete
MTQEKKYNKLLNEYNDLKDKIMEIDDRFHDGMYYDIMGYEEESYENLDYLPELESQVKACRDLLKGLKALKYIFC